MSKQTPLEKAISPAAAEKRYTKRQLLASEKFRARRDLLSVLLSGEKTYTAGEVDALADNYLKGKVK